MRFSLQWVLWSVKRILIYRGALRPAWKMQNSSGIARFSVSDFVAATLGCCIFQERAIKGDNWSLRETMRAALSSLWGDNGDPVSTRAWSGHGYFPGSLILLGFSRLVIETLIGWFCVYGSITGFNRWMLSGSSFFERTYCIAVDY